MMLCLGFAPVSLARMARLTFPDQQQDLQNAAGFTLAIECDGSGKFARLIMEADLGRFWLPGGVQVG
jgi:hypothetical protein